jgi:hypothetical protein
MRKADGWEHDDFDAFDFGAPVSTDHSRQRAAEVIAEEMDEYH